MADGVGAYYKAHPERFGDARSMDAMTISTRDGLARMLAVLDQYDITVRKDL